MKTLAAVGLLCMLLAGCARIAGYAGTHPGTITCKGKVSLMGTGNFTLGAGLGGGETGTFSLIGDCGEGFNYTQGQPASSLPGMTAPPSLR